jgi:hypothetical protein
VVAALAELRGEEGEKGSKSLASGKQQMLGDLGEIGIIGRCSLEKPLLDAGEGFPNSGNTNEALEVFHP